MIARTSILTFFVVFCPTLQASDDAVTNFGQLKRIMAVSEKLSFPSRAGIRIWQQHSDGNGTGATVDADEWLLTRVANLWSDKCERQDLRNVAIISDNGRSIQFVDLRMIRAGGREDVTVKRGDVVVFLHPQRDE